MARSKADEAQRAMVRTLLRKGIEMGLSVGLMQAMDIIATAAHEDLEQGPRLFTPARKAKEKAYSKVGAQLKTLMETKGWRKPVIEANLESLFNGIIGKIEAAVIEGNGKAEAMTPKEAGEQEVSDDGPEGP